jgi:hypothetical protein
MPKEKVTVSRTSLGDGLTKEVFRQGGLTYILSPQLDFPPLEIFLFRGRDLSKKKYLELRELQGGGMPLPLSGQITPLQKWKSEIKSRCIFRS